MPRGRVRQPFKKGTTEADEHGGRGGLLNFFKKKERPKPAPKRGRPTNANANARGGRPRKSSILVQSHRHQGRLSKNTNGGRRRRATCKTVRVQVSSPGESCVAHGQVLAASVPVDFFATALVEGEQGLVVGKLTALGTVVGHCGVVNSEEMMERMREQLAFAAAQAEVEKLEDEDKTKKKDDRNKEHEDLFPKAAQKLEKLSRNIAGLYTKEIEAILYSVYNKTIFGSKLRKPDYVKALEKELLANANKYETLLLTLAVQAVVPVEATVEAPPPTAVATAPVEASAAATI